MADMVKPILFGLPHAIPVMSDFFIFEGQVDRAGHCTNLVDFPLTYCYLYANVLMYMERRLGKKSLLQAITKKSNLTKKAKRKS